jgi:hypothetical protein
VIPTRAYLTAKGHRLDPLLRRYLESVLTAPFTFFEVVDCNPGNGMTLRDVMTREEHAVTERSASRKMQRGDLLFAQLALVDHLTMLEASNGFAISPMEKAPIIAFRAALAAVEPEITCNARPAGEPHPARKSAPPSSKTGRDFTRHFGERGPGAGGPASDYAPRPQRGAACLVEAEALGEHLIGVLAEQRRR